MNKLILHYAGGSTTRFANMLGISQQTLSNWKKRGTIDYERIYTNCVGLNPHWLLTGEGEMIVSNEIVSDCKQNPDTEKEKLDFIISSIKEMKKEIKELQEAQRRNSTSSMCG
ncbi:MAG: helix-turn-helix domain containing protein [Paludibacteraceae bacterium]|nr:helix-turn-helix domain containing protein [Paludibacteraceae bacterium]